MSALITITMDPAVSAHSLAFPWRRMTNTRDARVTRRTKLTIIARIAQHYRRVKTFCEEKRP